MNVAIATAAARSDAHPRGLFVLAVTEIWERFSYYGMRALLVFYMTKHLLMGQAESSQVYGFYTAAVWLTPFFGGLLADRVLGQHRAVVIGGTLMAIGHFLLAFEAAFFVALAAIALGNGLFKPNVSTQVGDLYPPGDSRRDRGYGLFYMGMNFGAFIAPLGCGTVGELYGWHWGFGLAGVGMLAGLAIYVRGMRWLPPDRLLSSPIPTATRSEGHSLSAPKRILGLVAVSLAASLFWTVFEQQGNVIALWADGYTDRAVDIGGLHATIPASWFPGLNGFFIVALTPAIVGFWRRQSLRGSEPRILHKMAIGASLGAASYGVLCLAALHQQQVAVVSWLWLVAYFGVLTAGEIYLSPTCLSLFNRAAPARHASTLLGVWYGSLFIGSFLAGYTGTYWQRVPRPAYFAAMAAIAALSALSLLLVSRTLGRTLDR